MNFMVMDRERRFGSDERIRVLAFSRHGQLILACSISPEASSTFDLSSGTIRRRSSTGGRGSTRAVAFLRKGRGGREEEDGGQDRLARRAGEICWHNSSYRGSSV